MNTLVGFLSALVIGASLAAATVEGVVQTQAPNDEHARQSTTVLR